MLVPTALVTANIFQQIWKQGFVPRQLEDSAFACYMSRCQRKQLVTFITKLLSLTDSSDITHIIHCIGSYYLVFHAKSAPNRDRWKKYKNKVTANEMGIRFAQLQLMGVGEKDLEQLRQKIELMTMK